MASREFLPELHEDEADGVEEEEGDGSHQVQVGHVLVLWTVHSTKPQYKLHFIIIFFYISSMILSYIFLLLNFPFSQKLTDL
jgi:hypothetical protein